MKGSSLTAWLERRFRDMAKEQGCRHPVLEVAASDSREWREAVVAVMVVVVV